MKQLEYPFESNYILRKKRAIKKELLVDENKSFIDKKIAILCGSTADEIGDILELFLLNNGIRPVIHLSEYGKYWEDVMFDDPDLVAFAPDLIFIHTTSRNIEAFPTVGNTEEEIDSMLEAQFSKFRAMWEKISDKYGCTIIQNNFEQPFFRLLGNKDVSDIHGRLNFVNRLNDRFYEYSRDHDNFYINDINYMASCYGIQKWANESHWCLYKYAMDINAIPEFSFNLANIIKSIYGKNKKAFVLDLDNTLWGGIIGDDGVENIEIGRETAEAEVYTEFQEYLRSHKDLGIVLNIDSKNYEDVAVEGLLRPDSVLKPDDFLIRKINWDPKDKNIEEIANEINIGLDSLVFIDDNPAERHIIQSRIPQVSVPEVEGPETYIRLIDRNGYFEVTNLSEDDLKRNTMYKANVERARQEASFSDYGDYLKSLEMEAEIGSFADMYISRISQLTNKTNQFNLTTKRCSVSDIDNYRSSNSYITLYGKLSDKFGDNGVVAISFGHIEGHVFHIDQWLMSCRVLKRDMEMAMMDELVRECLDRNISEIRGYYYPTPKNKMVKDFYREMEFHKVFEDSEGNTQWVMKIDQNYKNKNRYIKVNR